MNTKNFLILISVLAGCNVAWWGYVSDSPFLALACGACSGINLTMAIVVFLKGRT